MTINCTGICEAIFDVIRQATSQHSVEQLELELRLEASPLFFYRRFSECTRMRAFDKDSAVYRGSQTLVTHIGAKRLRTEYAEAGQRLLGATLKERIGVPRDFYVDQGRLRVDLARETRAEPTPSERTRHKQRVSFRLKTAPCWRIDFSRVHMGGVQSHEIEVELDTAMLLRCKTVDDAERLARQAAVVLTALGITTPRTADDEIECD